MILCKLNKHPKIMFIVTFPFIGKDITPSKVYEVSNKLCLGYIKSIDIFENYDSKKVFRSAEVAFSEIFQHEQSRNICKQLGEGGEVVIKMHKKKVSRWIMRANREGSIFGLRPMKNQKRIYIDI